MNLKWIVFSYFFVIEFHLKNPAHSVKYVWSLKNGRKRLLAVSPCSYVFSFFGVEFRGRFKVLIVVLLFFADFGLESGKSKKARRRHHAPSVLLWKWRRQWRRRKWRQWRRWPLSPFSFSIPTPIPILHLSAKLVEKQTLIFVFVLWQCIWQCIWQCRESSTSKTVARRSSCIWMRHRTKLLISHYETIVI